MSARQLGLKDSERGNYVVTAQRPTAIKSSCVGYFTSPEHMNLIISKVTRIEIHRLTDDGLEGMLDVPIYGRVASMQLFRPPGRNQDLLFFLTEKLKFCILEYNLERDELVSKSIGDASAKVGRCTEWGVTGYVDPQSKMIVIHAYDALLKIIYLDNSGGIKSSWDVRIDELSVVDIKFLHSRPRPTLAVLYKEPTKERHVKIYEVPSDEKVKSLRDGPITSNLGQNVSLLIPIPAPLGGVVIVSESVITYLSTDDRKTIRLADKSITAYSLVDPDGSRILLGDLSGSLHLLVLSHDDTKVLGLKLQSLGDINAPSTLSYLDNGVVFVGSCFGDSQLIKLHAQPLNPSQPHDFVEVLDTFTNLGPIVDFCAMDLDRQGQVQVVTCSGVGRDGSLRVVRSGIGMVGQATVELEGIRGLWNLRPTFEAPSDSMLVLSFVGDTQILGMDEADELTEIEPEDMDADIQTLFCGNLVGDYILQISARRALLLSSSRKFVADWKPPTGTNINVATANASQILLVSGKGNLVLLEVSNGALVEKTVKHFDVDIACLDLTPLEPTATSAAFAAMGMWDESVQILGLPDLNIVTVDKIAEGVVPRNVLLTTLGPANRCYLLLAMGDGKLINYEISPENGSLTDRKSIALGTRPIHMRSFMSDGSRYVFAASDRPTIIHSSHHKLMYSNLNEDEVNFMSAFNTSSFPDNLALAKDDSLTIGRIDQVQKLHVRTVPLGEQPFRVCHCSSARAILVITNSSVPSGVDQLHLVDENTFEIKDSFSLDQLEKGVSLCTVHFKDDPNSYIAMGTAHVVPTEPEPKSGRIVIFEIVEGKLTKVSSKMTYGAVYCALPFQQGLLCGINSMLQLFEWQPSVTGGKELAVVATHSRGQVLTLYIRTRGNLVLIGDVMRSMSLLEYKQETQTFEFRARDQHTAWMMALEMFDDDIFIGAENGYNLLTVSRNTDALQDYERSRLKSTGLYHLGEAVNQFQKGSLVMQNFDNPAFKEIQSMLYATISGSIGVVASLPNEIFNQLADLEVSMRKVVQGVGGLDHSEWRAFTDEHSYKPLPARNFIDGDLIEQFLELGKDAMQKIVGGMTQPSTVEGISRLVEELSRALH